MARRQTGFLSEAVFTSAHKQGQAGRPEPFADEEEGGVAQEATEPRHLFHFVPEAHSVKDKE